jgi:hypothetical protein
VRVGYIVADVVVTAEILLVRSLLRSASLSLTSIDWKLALWCNEQARQNAWPDTQHLPASTSLSIVSQFDRSLPIVAR